MDLNAIEGLHFHALCEESADALEAVLKAFEEKFGKWIGQMKWVNFGGGHHITKKAMMLKNLLLCVKISVINMACKFILNQAKRWVGKQEWWLV